MKRRFKKTVSKILLLSMILSLLFTNFNGLKVYAVGSPFDGGDGTSGDPYQISTQAQLSEMRNYRDSAFILTDDITLTGSWTPIGSGVADAFIGKLDGNWHSIKSLNVVRGADYNGLFGYTRNARILNVSIDGSVMSRDYTGILVGYAYNTHIEKVVVSGSSYGRTYVGGMVGEMYDATDTIMNSYSIATVKGNSYAGGLVGYLRASNMSYSYSTGIVEDNNLVEGTSADIGGLVGVRQSSTITDSYYDTSTSNQTDNTKGEPQTTADLKTSAHAIYSNWDYTPGTGVWEFRAGENDGYPVLIGPDTTAPNVSVLVAQIKHPNGVSAYNNGDKVTGISSDEVGTLYVVKDGETVTDADSLEALVTAKKAAKVAAAAAGTNYNIQLSSDIELGEYKAYAVDLAGNVSTPSSIKIYVSDAPGFVITSTDAMAPVVHDVTPTTAKLGVAVDMDAKVYYKVQLAAADDVTDGAIIKSEATSIDFTFEGAVDDLTDTTITGLTKNTEYEVFFVAESTGGTPTLSPVIVKRIFETTGLNLSGLIQNHPYTMKQPAIRISENLTVSNSGSFADGFLQFSVTDSAITETLDVIKVNAPVTINGIVSIVDSNIYLGDGTNASIVGTIDEINNGKEGKPLKFNFSTPLENGTFEVTTSNGSIEGWTINKNSVTLGVLATKTKGGNVTSSGMAPYTITGPNSAYSFNTDRNYTKEGVERANSSVTFNSEIVTEGGNKKLRLMSSGSIAGPSNIQPFGTIFGPEAISSPFQAKSGDTLRFDWKAANGGDDYEVYGFIEKLDAQDGIESRKELMYGRGLNQAWTSSEGTIDADGEYQYRFVCGTYDNTGGLGVGASLYIDNVRLYRSIQSDVVQQVARLVTYKHDGTGIDLLRTITVQAQTQDGLTDSKTTTVQVTGVQNATPSVPSSGGGGGGSTEAGANVIVNGKSESAGTLTKDTKNGVNTLNLNVDEKQVDKRIDAVLAANDGTENIVQVPITTGNSDRLVVSLTGDLVKKMETNEFKLSVKEEKVEYLIPAEELTIDKVAKSLNIAAGDLADIDVEIRITKANEEFIAKAKEIAKQFADELVVEPVNFEIYAKTTNTDGTTSEKEISTFSNYVQRIIEIPAGVDPSKITTGIVFNTDGTYSHVPTEVFQKDGKWYARLNSLTNSTYSVIYNPITVASVANHWSKAFVNDMASRLIISNPETFLPQGTITRGEFAEYITKALGIYRTGTATGNKFTDVKTSNKLADAIEIAAAYGIVKGYTDGTFKANATITREEAMTMYCNAMGITDLSGSELTKAAAYSDYKTVAVWAKTYVNQVVAAGVFNGQSPTKLAPKSTLTYAEAATAVRNLLVASELINKQ